MATCVPSTNAAIKRTMQKIMPARSPQSTFNARRNVANDAMPLPVSMDTLGGGNLKSTVVLPQGEDVNEWIAAKIVDFFNQLNMLYGTITEYCTASRCPTMCAGPKYEYYWQDASTRKISKCCAPKYIDYLMAWVQSQLDDDSLFPSKIGVPFPAEFQTIARQITKRLFRIYAHVYYQHLEDIKSLKEDAHLNTSFKHFMLFVNEFSLIEHAELAPLSQLILQLTGVTIEVEGTNPSSNQ